MSRPAEDVPAVPTPPAPATPSPDSAAPATNRPAPVTPTPETPAPATAGPAVPDAGPQQTTPVPEAPPQTPTPPPSQAAAPPSPAPVVALPPPPQVADLSPPPQIADLPPRPPAAVTVLPPPPADGDDSDPRAAGNPAGQDFDSVRARRDSIRTALEFDAPSPEAGPDEHAARERDRPVITAAEAVARLRRGQPLEKVRVKRLVFEGVFDMPVVLRGVTLERPVFRNVEFREDAVFGGCTFDKPHFERKVEFAKACNLRSSVWHHTGLYNVKFGGPVDAAGLRADGKFHVNRCTFGGRVSFWEADFDCWTDFKDCRFEGDADLRSIDVSEGLVFHKCVFNGQFLFRGSSVAKKLDFGDSTFHQLADFSKAKLHDFVYLQNVRLEGQAGFAFANAVVERLLIRQEQLEGRLVSERKGDWETAMSEYGLLKRTFENMHSFEQEDWAFYRFKVARRRSVPRSWSRPWGKLAEFADWLLLDVGCGYCTKPGRAVRAALVLLFGFALIYAAGIDRFHVEAGRLPFPDEPLESAGNRLVVATLFSVSALTSGFGGMHDNGSGWIYVPLVMESLLGTFLWGLFIVAFGRKVIR